MVAFPNALFDLAGMPSPRYPQLWQCIGMIVGVYGVGYLAAARDPWRHWPIVLVGLLGKVFGPIGFAQALIAGDLPPAFGVTILTNDLLWWAPFAMILWGAARARHEPLDRPPTLSEALHSLHDQHGRSLADVTDQRPTLVLLLRHAGCIFCTQALADLAGQRQALERAGLALAVVSMSQPQDLARRAQRFGLEGVVLVSDPDRMLYRALALPRGRFAQLFGPAVWWRGLRAWLQGHRIGRLDGDGFQMPGAFVLHKGQVLAEHRHRPRRRTPGPVHPGGRLWPERPFPNRCADARVRPDRRPVLQASHRPPSRRITSPVM
ncbi:MAG: hypothetical protein KatS3mg103_0351 [Phycisphaerales bacterium]|nr:MAG: hypothetical protein KatS3mg103_0351 [Phycisphaerales bacterium]